VITVGILEVASSEISCFKERQGQVMKKHRTRLKHVMFYKKRKMSIPGFEEDHGVGHLWSSEKFSL
jgi:hypothetical protein